MVPGTQSDFQIYPDQFFGGFVETLQQQVELFNENSGGALQMIEASMRGNNAEESFFDNSAGNWVSRRDITSTAAATDIGLDQSSIIKPKVNRKIGPVAHDHNAFRKLGLSPEEMSLIYGQKAGPDVAADMLNTLLASVRAGIEEIDDDIGTGAAVFDRTAGTMRHIDLNSGFALMGDRAARVRTVVMHSKVFHDLVGQAITDNVFQVADVAIFQGLTPALGRTIVVTDSANLVTAGTPNTYHTLCLVEGAARVVESEDREIASERITGGENIFTRIQGEYAYNVEIKGVSYSGGQVNPTLAQLQAIANWTWSFQDVKLGPGVMINSQ